MLSEHWPQLLSISKKKFDFISEAILATDMALHSQYEDRLMHENPMKQITLISLIIKAADISNVTRTLSISARWAYLITLEFNDCALSENQHSCMNRQNSLVLGGELYEMFPKERNH